MSHSKKVRYRTPMGLYAGLSFNAVQVNKEESLSRERDAGKISGGIGIRSGSKVAAGRNMSKLPAVDIERTGPSSSKVA